MIELYEHNQQTYKNLIRLFESNNRVACVQPTGTGKSFIMLKLIEDNPGKRFLITSPSVYIFEQIRDCAAENGVDISSCEFYTYQRIVYMSDEDIKSIKADYIFLDEFHRLGSPKWGGGVLSFYWKRIKTAKYSAHRQHRFAILTVCVIWQKKYFQTVMQLICILPRL